MPVHYADLMERMLRSVAAKEDVVAEVMRNVAERWRSGTGRVHMRPDAGTEERVEQVTESLKARASCGTGHAEATAFTW
jgi:hypothetical protein